MWRLLALLLAVSSVWAGELRAGRAAVRITPPAGIPMAGYFSVRLAEGTHDELYAKAIVLEQEGVTAALVSCDLIGLDGETVRAARRLIEDSAGIPSRHVMISATHSHTGPLLRNLLLEAAGDGPREIARRYIESLPAKIAEAVRLARADLRPARVWAAKGHEDTLVFHRRFLMKDGSVRFNPGKLNPDIVRPVGTVDPEVPVVFVDSARDGVLAMGVNYALHLDTVGGARFSADYPYTLSKSLGDVFGPSALTLFTLGTAGDINHIDVSHREAQRGHGEAARIGTVLAAAVLKAYGRRQAVPVGKLAVRSEVVELATPVYGAQEVENARKLASRLGQPKPPPFLELVHALSVLEVAALQGKPVLAEVQVIALGETVAWVGLPGEIFVDLGLEIKRSSPFPTTVVASLTNGSIAYVPTRKGFSEGGYEAVNSRCTPGAGERLVETALALLKQLKN